MDGMYREGKFPGGPEARACQGQGSFSGRPGQEGAASLFLKVLSTCHQLLSAHGWLQPRCPQGRAQPGRVPGFVLLSVGELGWGWASRPRGSEAQRGPPSLFPRATLSQAAETQSSVRQERLASRKQSVPGSPRGGLSHGVLVLCVQGWVTAATELQGGRAAKLQSQGGGGGRRGGKSSSQPLPARPALWLPVPEPCDSPRT